MTNYNEHQFQSKVEPLRNIPVEVGELEKYVVWKPIKEKIRKLEKKREGIKKSVISINEIKEMLLKELETEKELGYDKDDGKALHKEIEYLQNHSVTNPDVAVEKLAKVYILKKGKQALDVINVEDYEKGVSKEERESNIKKIEDEIAELKSKLPKYDGMIFDSEDYIIMWKVIVPRFLEPVSCDGRYLDVNENLDKKLLEIYNQLKLGDIPKIRLEYPVKINGKEYKVPPGWGSPLREEK